MAHSDVDYRPLLADEGDEAGQGVPDHSEGLQGLVTDHKRQTASAYVCFLILGAATLLPWNTLIVCFPYIHSRLEHSNFASSYSSWLSLSYTFFTLSFMLHANLSQTRARQSSRVSFSIVFLTCNILFLTLTTQFPSIPPNVYFFVLLFLSIFLAASTAYMQNALASLSSSFGPTYLQAFMSGQGIVAVAVSVVQMTSSAATSDPGKDALAALAKGTFIFLLIATAFCVVAFFSLITLINLPIFKSIMKASIANDDDTNITYMSRFLEMRRVERLIRPLCFSVMFIFLVTLTAFPSVTTTIASTSSSNSIWTTLLFVPFSYVVFNVGDWLGRSLPGFSQFQWAVDGGKSSVQKLSIAALSRVAFIPLFLACNVTPRQGDPLINSDIAYITILFLFALTNGYFCTLIMIAGINKSVIPEKDIQIAATCLALYLNLGLALGSLMSFVARAVLCGCNPFVAV